MARKKKVTMKSSLPPFWEHFKSRYREIEEAVEDKEGAYVKHEHEALYTSSEDLETIFHHELVRGTFCDLGCGTGQAPLLYGYFFPERRAIGIEFDVARIKAGREFQSANVELVHADLLTSEIPDADTYFLYFPTGPVLDRVLNELFLKKHFFNLVAIESHGDLLPRLAFENWLVLNDEVELKTQRHYPRARIYAREFCDHSKEHSLFEHSFKESFLEIHETGETWIGESLGLEWSEGDKFNLKTPPRTISRQDVKKLVSFESMPPEWQTVVKLRRLGEIEIRTRENLFRGIIRKIIVGPLFLVEISSGERIQWSEIMTITQGSRPCYVSSSHS